jgi:hypothetical protein
MLRKTLLHKILGAAALLAASTGVMAGGDYVYGRVITAEPHFSISFGSGRHHDGFRILYEVGGQHYWTHSPYHPGHVIWVPRPVGHYIHHHKHHHKHHRHDWDDRRDGWRDGRGEWGEREHYRYRD